MRLSESRPVQSGLRVDCRSGQQVAGKPTGADEANASASSMAVDERQSQQAAEEYCAELPLDLCHGCDGCGMRCTEGVRMTQIEFIRVERFVCEHPAEIDRVQAQSKEIPGWPETKFCQFRDTEYNRCSIYPVRPVVCRLFGHTEWLPCPLEIVPLRGREAMDVYQRYAAQEVRTFDEWRQVRDELPQAD